MTDFLWDCTCESIGKMYVKNNVIDNLSVLQVKLSKCKHNSDSVITVNESKGSGVFDSIGGVLWEAALLLCTHILQNLTSFESINILELGSGVGLPGLLLTHLRSVNSSSSDGSITFSDNDSSVISNLHSTITQQFVVETDLQSNYQLVQLANLNWRVFASTNNSIIKDADDTDLFDGSEGIIVNADVDNSNFDMLMGSALCYTSEHVCLADLIKYYLSGHCNSVVICQISDRQGFAQLLERLIELDVMFTVQPISEQTYQLAQRIRRCTSQAPVVVDSEDGVEDGGGEDEVHFHTQYDFKDCGPLFSNSDCEAPSESSSEWRSDLLTTPRSAFVMLTANKGSYRELHAM